jgi:uncharacterized membrane protein
MLGWVYNPFNKLVRRIVKMKSKIYLVIFSIAIVTLAQLLTYYATPSNWQMVVSLPEHPPQLAAILIIFALTIIFLVLLMRLIREEDKKHEDKIKKENEERNQNLIKAFKEIIKETLSKTKGTER